MLRYAYGHVVHIFYMLNVDLQPSPCEMFSELSYRLYLSVFPM